ncbi:hypothetical protein ACFUCV_08990 [Specibacter sp. NPDC057265]|uniref:hypothetical protein n=1 Tax=Specibacter sp. NPDC057265 TaxID=3346075 RepID=UPI0036458A7A
MFSAARQSKKDDAELGKGVWRRAYDRFHRGLDRFHQMLEGLEAASFEHSDAGARAAECYGPMVAVADALAELLPEVRRIAAAAHAAAPSEGMEIPLGTGGKFNDVHRELSRAGNALAAASEALALVRLGAGEVSGVKLKASIVGQHITRAAGLLQGEAPK